MSALVLMASPVFVLSLVTLLGANLMWHATLRGWRGTLREREAVTDKWAAALGQRDAALREREAALRWAGGGPR